jgi:hypothetical protein
LKISRSSRQQIVTKTPSAGMEYIRPLMRPDSRKNKENVIWGNVKGDDSVF